MKNKNRFFKNMKTKVVSLAAAAAVIPTMLPSVVYFFCNCTTGQP